MALPKASTLHAPQQPPVWNDHHHYALQLVLKPEVTQAIDGIRKAFEEAHHLTLAKRPLQMTVVSFYATESFLPTILRWLQNLAVSTSSFSLALNNFSGIPPHEIYLRVVDQPQHQQFHQQIRLLSDTIAGFADVVPVVESQWRIPLVEQLPGMLFDKAIQYFARQELFLNTAIESICLVCQPRGQQPRQVIQQFSLSSSREVPAHWFNA